VPELGRIDVRQVARITGFADTDIPVLVRARLLRPIGNPGPTSPRYFSAVEVRDLAASREWLDKAQRATSQHWQQRNRARAHQSTSSPFASKSSFVKTRSLLVPSTPPHSH
jgi:hypothetical protein